MGLRKVSQIFSASVGMENGRLGGKWIPRTLTVTDVSDAISSFPPSPFTNCHVFEDGEVGMGMEMFDITGTSDVLNY